MHGITILLFCGQLQPVHGAFWFLIFQKEQTQIILRFCISGIGTEDKIKIFGRQRNTKMRLDRIQANRCFPPADFIIGTQ